MNNKQVAHNWALRNKTHGSGSNFFFSEDELFSYRQNYMLAKHFNGGVLVRYTPYSSSTARHKQLAILALMDASKKHVEVENVNPQNMDDHYQNLDDLAEEAQNALDDFHRRKPGSQVQEHARRTHNQIKGWMRGYIELFNIADHLVKINKYDLEDI